MANFNFSPKVNPKDNSTYYEAQFTAKLVGLSDNVLENQNKTEYVVGTIEYENAQGKNVQASTMIYKANLDHGMTVGTSYLTTVRVIPGDDRGPLVTTSHLTSAPRASMDDFGFEIKVAEKEAAKNEVYADVE